MIATIRKYWNRMRDTEADLDRRVRQYCIQVASSYEGKNLDNMLRCSQRVYDWLHGCEPPAEHHDEVMH